VTQSGCSTEAASRRKMSPSAPPRSTSLPAPPITTSSASPSEMASQPPPVRTSLPSKRRRAGPGRADAEQPRAGQGGAAGEVPDARDRGSREVGSVGHERVVAASTVDPADAARAEVHHIVADLAAGDVAKPGCSMMSRPTPSSKSDAPSPAETTLLVPGVVTVAAFGGVVAPAVVARRARDRHAGLATPAGATIDSDRILRSFLPAETAGRCMNREQRSSSYGFCNAAALLRNLEASERLSTC
jgi:hypothetical protein